MKTVPVIASWQSVLDFPRNRLRPFKGLGQDMKATEFLVTTIFYLFTQYMVFTDRLVAACTLSMLYDKQCAVQYRVYVKTRAVPLA